MQKELSFGETCLIIINEKKIRQLQKQKLEIEKEIKVIRQQSKRILGRK